MLLKNLEYLGHTLTLSSGWTRVVIAFFLGACASLGQAPFHFVPLVVVAFTGLVWLLDGAVSEHVNRSEYKAAFRIGFWFGLGYFLVGLYWLSYAFFVEAEAFAYMMPFGILGLCAGLSLFFGCATLLARSLWSINAARIVALALSFTIFEWLRGTILTGFPWNSIGYVAAFSDISAQGLSLIGIWGYTFCTVLIAAVPAVLIDQNYKFLKFLISFSVCGIIIGLGFYGATRLKNADVTMQNIDKAVQIRIVQPNIDQKTIQRSQQQDKQIQVESLLSLSKIDNLEPNSYKKNPDILIWPETAFPYLWEDRPEILSEIQDVLNSKTVLVTGVHRKEVGGASTAKYYNSLYVLDPKAAIQNVYDKNHLVPFGEYLPFQMFLEYIGLEQITRQSGGFTPGRQREQITIGNIPAFMPLICYEAIFSDEIIDEFSNGAQRPEFLINITNDGWFGNSTGPYQHFHQVRMRAVETGLPIIRAANTGISAIIDPYGRILQSLPLGRRGTVDGQLPKALTSTIYETHKNLIILSIVFLSMLFVFICKRYK